MKKGDITNLYLSQFALSTYDTCPLKFRRRYLDGLYWPGQWALTEEQREAMELGQQFHLLAYRYYSHIDIDNLLKRIKKPLNSWLERLLSFLPVDDNKLFFPEQELRFNRDGLRLMAKYDLLVKLPDDRIVIYEWKTTPLKPLKRYYANNIQTIFYRYLLVKAGNKVLRAKELNPGNISIIYWNPRYPNIVEPVTYSYAEYKRDEKIIMQKIEDILQRDYEDFFATSDEKRCTYCEYSPICHGETIRSVNTEDIEDNFELSWEDIDAINFDEEQ